MFSDLGKTQWLPQIDINAVEAQASGITLVLVCSAPFYCWLWILQGEVWGQINLSSTQYEKSS